MRTKMVELDGEQELVSSLVRKQLKHYLSKFKEAKTLEEKEALVAEIVCGSMNRAQELTGDKVWTPEKLDAAYDDPFYELLQTEICKLSGLRIVKGAVEPGEVAAA
jgi:hypothetical protein